VVLLYLFLSDAWGLIFWQPSTLFLAPVLFFFTYSCGSSLLILVVLLYFIVWFFLLILEVLLYIILRFSCSYPFSSFLLILLFFFLLNLLVLLNLFLWFFLTYSCPLLEDWYSGSLSYYSLLQFCSNRQEDMLHRAQEDRETEAENLTYLTDFLLKEHELNSTILGI
jgi:hypothetical protein